MTDDCSLLLAKTTRFLYIYIISYFLITALFSAYYYEEYKYLNFVYHDPNTPDDSMAFY